MRFRHVLDVLPTCHGRVSDVLRKCFICVSDVLDVFRHVADGFRSVFGLFRRCHHRRCRRRSRRHRVDKGNELVCGSFCWKKPRLKTSAKTGRDCELISKVWENFAFQIKASNLT